MRFFWVLLPLALYGSEPLLGLLERIEPDGTLLFDVGNGSRRCAPYGIIMLQSVGTNEGVAPACREAVRLFFARNPESPGFGATLLKVQQRYHIEIEGAQCRIYARGRRSYSSLLLEAGLAFVRESLQDSLRRYELKRSEARAKNEKRGLWSDPPLRECAANLSAGLKP
jgi:hypothetical protein